MYSPIQRTIKHKRFRQRIFIFVGCKTKTLCRKRLCLIVPCVSLCIECISLELFYEETSRQEVNDVNLQCDARLLSDDNLITVLETKRHCAARSFHSVFWHLTGFVLVQKMYFCSPWWFGKSIDMYYRDSWNSGTSPLRSVRCFRERHITY